MKFKENTFKTYLNEAPLPLALERWLECELYKTKEFPRPILDIGCGEGMYAYVLFDEKVDTGIDPNEKELKRASEYSAYDELIKCSGDSIPKPDKMYKTIFSNSVLEHIPDIDSVLKEAHRLLADDGKMYVTVPSDMFDHYSVFSQLLTKLGLKTLAKKHRVFFNDFWAHYHYYDISGWTEVFNRNGFKVIEIKEYATKASCIINNLLAPFSIVSFIMKKMTNRWFLFPRLRKVVASILNTFLVGSLDGPDNLHGKRGGLVFLEVTRQDSKI